MNITRLNGVKDVIIERGSGGNSGGSGENTLEYIDVSGANGLVKTSIVQYAVYVKGYIESYGAYMTGSTLYVLKQMASDAIDATSAIAIDFSNVVLMKMGDTIQNMTVAEAILQNGATQAEIDALPRITKEEFYTI